MLQMYRFFLSINLKVFPNSPEIGENSTFEFINLEKTLAKFSKICQD